MSWLRFFGTINLLDYSHKNGYIEIVIIMPRNGGRDMQKQFSIAEAKSKLPAIVHSVEEGPSVKLTRHGRPVAVLLSIREYERLNRKREGFWSALMAFRKAVEKENIEISDSDFEALRDTSPGRKSEWS